MAEDRDEGLNTTGLPVTIAAETMPIAMAKGKFHGAMTAATPCNA